MNRTADSIKNPLFRFFDRENQIGRALLKKIRQDLEDIKKVCDGELKQTNHLRMLLNCLTKGWSLFQEYLFILSLILIKRVILLISYSNNFDIRYNTRSLEKI